MTQKPFGVKQLNVIGAAGTPTIESAGDLNIGGQQVAITTNTSIAGVITATAFVGDGANITGISTSNITNYSGGDTSGISSVGIQSGGVLVGSASTINFVTTGSVSVSNDIATVSVGSSIRFVGARIYHDNYTPTGTNATYEVQNWDGTSIDTHSFVDSSNGFTIPAGVSKVRLIVGARASTGSVANQWFIFKNGSALSVDAGGIFVESEANSGYNNGSVTGVTGVISVTEGDTFDLRYYLNSTTPTWDIFFEIEVIEGDILGNYFAGGGGVESSGVKIENNGTSVGTGITTINFNTNVTATASGGIATITASSGGGGSIAGINTTGTSYFNTIDLSSKILSDTFSVKDAGDSVTKMFFGDSGTGHAVRLYNGGSEKFTTTSSGIFVQGSVGCNGGANITGVVTATSFQGNTTTGDGSDRGFTTKYYITANGASAYRFAGPGVLNSADNPTLYFHRGFTYILENSTGSGHPFALRVSSGGSNYAPGGSFLTGSQNGTQILTVPFDGPSSIVYQCTLHGGMLGTINFVS